MTDKLNAALDSFDRKDAQRYRWIADNCGCPFAETDSAWDSKASLDAAIDAALAQPAASVGSFEQQALSTLGGLNAAYTGLFGKKPAQPKPEEGGVSDVQAMNALESLDDYARMDCGVAPTGPYNVLHNFILQHATTSGLDDMTRAALDDATTSGLDDMTRAALDDATTPPVEEDKP